MIYMVEMALLDTARRAEWDAWYVAHQHRLLSIPGFRASQRFEAIHAAESPFVALHEVDSPDIFAGPIYRAKAGPSNTGEWQAKMGNWHRNLFAVDHTPDVPMDARLVVVEDGAEPGVAGGRVGAVDGGCRAGSQCATARARGDVAGTGRAARRHAGPARTETARATAAGRGLRQARESVGTPPQARSAKPRLFFKPSRTLKTMGQTAALSMFCQRRERKLRCRCG